MKVERYVQCRLTVDTHTRLTAFLGRLKSKAARAPGKYRPALSRGKVGLSDAIDELIFRLDLEESRKKSYSKGRRRKGRMLGSIFEDPEVQRMIDEGCPNHS